MMAERLVEHFREDTLDFIETAADRLTEVGGIGPARVRNMKPRGRLRRKFATS